MSSINVCIICIEYLIFLNKQEKPPRAIWHQKYGFIMEAIHHKFMLHKESRNSRLEDTELKRLLYGWE